MLGNRAGTCGYYIYDDGKSDHLELGAVGDLSDKKQNGDTSRSGSIVDSDVHNRCNINIANHRGSTIGTSGDIDMANVSNVDGICLIEVKIGEDSNGRVIDAGACSCSDL